MPTSPESQNSTETSFVEQICMPYIRSTQNQDGGWGFKAYAQSRVEPTAWALIALQEFQASGQNSGPDNEQIDRGMRFLAGAALPDGSWPSSPGQSRGSWVTSLACWAMLTQAPLSQELSLAKGLRWLVNEWPREAGMWWQLKRRLTRKQSVASQNDSYCGWSWTSGTASWVEPTSYALIALQSTPQRLLPHKAQRRQSLAASMLYDRMCPGGGWNCGNPMVYGVPGKPLVSATVWPLLALRENNERRENQMSLDWLAANWSNVVGPGSLALACMTLSACGRRNTAIGKSLRTFYDCREIFWTIPVVAWSALAFSVNHAWLNATHENS